MIKLYELSIIKALFHTPAAFPPAPVCLPILALVSDFQKIGAGKESISMASSAMGKEKSVLTQGIQQLKHQYLIIVLVLIQS